MTRSSAFRIRSRSGSLMPSEPSRSNFLAAGASGRGSSSTGTKRSPCSSILCSASAIPKSRGRSPGFSSSQRSGVDTGAPGFGRTEYTEAIVLPWPFCRWSTRTPSRFFFSHSVVTLPGWRCLEQPRRLLRERVRLRERRTPCDRRDDVDAVGAARLHVARQLELVEQLADEVRHLDRELEAVVGRVEVEEHEVRPVRLVDARVPRVHVDAVVLHHEQHRFRRIDEREVDEPRLALPRPRAELARRDPARQVLRRLLLEERLAVIPCG